MTMYLQTGAGLTSPRVGNVCRGASGLLVPIHFADGSVLLVDDPAAARELAAALPMAANMLEAARDQAAKERAA